MKKTVLTLSIFLISLSNISAQKYIGSEEDINQILKNIEAFSGFVMDSDYEGIARAYTEDGKIMPSGPKIIEGTKQ